MHSDDVVWHIINQTQCSFKIKTETQNFCRNEYNLTGMCNKSSCPLANSNYATVLMKKGRLYLYIKTIERQHTPAKWWEVIQLDRNYAKALEQIDDQLMYWNKFVIHKCKQRVTKITEMLKRMRKLRLEELPELVTIKKKAERREKSREAKASLAAKHETEIEKELMERLQAGTYGDIYNFDQKAFVRLTGGMEKEDVNEEELDEDEELDKLLAEEIIDEDLDLEYVLKGKKRTDGDEDDDDKSENDSAEEPTRADAKLGKRKKKGRRVELEFEENPEPEQEAFEQFLNN